jgi:hypothetical protein
MSRGAALADAATDPRMTLQRLHRTEVCVIAIPGALPLGPDPGPTDLVLISAQPELTLKASRAIDARIHECQAESWLSRKPVTILAEPRGARLLCAA